MEKPTIYTKLLEFQKQNVSIQKGKQNPHFKNKYADINEVLDKVKPALNELGVVILQVPEESGLRTILHDTESGTQVEGVLEFVQRADAQKLGSNITYNRRYSLIAMLGLEDDDDDGNQAATEKPKMTAGEAFNKLRACEDLESLKTVFTELPAHVRNDNEVVAVKDEMKGKLSSEEVIDA